MGIFFSRSRRPITPVDRLDPHLIQNITSTEFIESKLGVLRGKAERVNLPNRLTIINTINDMLRFIRENPAAVSPDIAPEIAGAIMTLTIFLEGYSSSQHIQALNFASIKHTLLATIVGAAIGIITGSLIADEDNNEHGYSKARGITLATGAFTGFVVSFLDVFTKNQKNKVESDLLSQSEYQAALNFVVKISTMKEKFVKEATIELNAIHSEDQKASVEMLKEYLENIKDALSIVLVTGESASPQGLLTQFTTWEGTIEENNFSRKLPLIGEFLSEVQAYVRSNFEDGEEQQSVQSSSSSIQNSVVSLLIRNLQLANTVNEELKISQVHSGTQSATL